MPRITAPVLFAAMLSFGMTTMGATLDVDKTNCKSTGRPFCTVNQAILAAANGDTIRIAAGEYLELIASFSKPLSFIGAGSASTRIQRMSFNGTGPLSISKLKCSGLQISGADHFSDLTVSEVSFSYPGGGDTPGEPGVRISNSSVSHLKVSSCTFTRYTGAGLAIDGNVATANVDDIVITNSTFDANKFGFMVMPHTTNVRISSSSFTNATLGGGIVLSRTDTATLDGLTVTGNNGNGIALTSSSNITLTNIKAERNSESGLVIGGNSSQVSIECSSMIGNGGVRNESSPQVVVNAEQIYWGCPGGPGAVGCSTISGAVDVLPFRDTRDAPCTARLTGITVTPPSVTIIATPLPSIVMRLNATAIFAEGSPKEATALVTWSSSDNAVVTVAPGGVVTMVGPGLATISASNGGVSGIATMRVSADPIAR